MTLLFTLHAILCALIAVRLLLFRRHGAVYRPWAARLAYGMIVMTAAAPIGVLFGRYDWAMLAQIGITAILCVAVYTVRGNVVELFRMDDGQGSWLLRLLRRCP